jgi:lipid-A-disaccharide synthase
MTRLFLVAGEASGDLHGALLASALKKIEPEVDLVGVGGSRMADAGVRLLARSDRLGVTGFLEVVRHLPRLRRLFASISSALLQERPDAFIPIDYPDFNLRLAARAHKAGIPIVYYISPQVWAWRRGRVKTLRRLVRRMVVIFPFEEEIYREAGVPVTYIGHPLVDQMTPLVSREVMRQRLGVGEEEILVALLPGSRKSEVERILPILYQTRHRLAGERQLRWVLALAPGFREGELSGIVRPDSPISIRSGETREILNAADLAITASGTATLEAALLGTPMLVLYRMHPVTWWIAKGLVRVPHIAMANLLAGKRLVPEFLQGEANPARLAAEVLRFTSDPALRAETRKELLAAGRTLGEGGAVHRGARLILDEVSSR